MYWAILNHPGAEKYDLEKISKNMVMAGAARRFELQIAYAIGVVDPVAVFVDTYGTGARPDEELARVVKEVVSRKRVVKAEEAPEEGEDELEDRGATAARAANVFEHGVAAVRGFFGMLEKAGIGSASIARI